MDMVSVGRVRVRRSTAVPSVVAYLGAAGFAVAGLWGYLIANAVTIRAQPAPPAGVPLIERQRLYLAWFVSMLGQERVSTAIAIAAFLCLAVVASFLGKRLALRPIASVGGWAIVVGAVLWVAGAVLQLGGHRAVGLMATHGNPIGAVNAVAFTIDMIEAAFAIAAFALIGIGLVAVAGSALGARSEPLAWILWTCVVALLTLALAASYLVDDGSLRDVLVLTTGVVGAPTWLLWTGTQLRTSDGSSRAS
jgi:hypothetical protein